jgi:hypothetical protein
MEFAFSCTKGQNSLSMEANDSYLTPEHVKVERHEPSKACIFESPARINVILEDSQVENSPCQIFDRAPAEGEETWVFGNARPD